MERWTEEKRDFGCRLTNLHCREKPGVQRVREKTSAGERRREKEEEEEEEEEELWGS